MFVVDSQVHLFPPDEPDAMNPLGHRTLRGTKLLKEMDTARVDLAILIPPRIEAATNEDALATASRWPSRFGVVAKLRPDECERSRDELSRWRGSGALGVRVSFPADSPGPGEDQANWLWRMAEDLETPVMVWCPGRVGELATVASRHPSVRIIIDHCGLSGDDRGARVGAVIREVGKLAGFTNIGVKASGLPDHSENRFPFRDLHEPIKRLVGDFGARRVFWGSDLTRLHCEYWEVVELFLSHLAFLSGSELESVMGLGICSWLNWRAPEPPHTDVQP